ncbi:MAG TPA: RHS repeat domain-containing protein, partial [Thermoanaerobaculia bacterium]|nr:RHS repeat domain-containing protein [Thermoanaerobaculia bacterium]
SEYLTYDLDVPGAGYLVSGTRTVFHDDGGKYVDRAFSDFDGLGHFRTVTHTDDFQLGGSPHVERTFWNPTRGSEPNWTPPTPTEPWILEVYSEKQATEGTSTVLTESSFDADGRLSCERRRLSPTARNLHDVVVTYTYDSAGNPIQENWHGGDLDEVGTAEICSVVDAPSTTILHTWQAGVRATTQHAGANFKGLDRTIHPGTGLVSSSRDVSGPETTYLYDSMGRVTKATPPDGEQPIHFTYHQPNPPATLGKIRVYRGDPETPYSDGEFWIDDFGRVYEERRLMPQGWARKRTFFNDNGWKSDESEWGAVGGGEAGLVFTGYRDYDPFGRPTLIHPPDSTPADRAHDVTISYTGTRVVSRTVSVGTGRNSTTNEPVETAVTTTERYDGQGRLVQVVEPAGANGASTTTSYGYDCAGRLRTVTQVDGTDTQTRTFSYDGRGFLTSETHPEKGVTGNGTVTYSLFDARGKAHRKEDGSATLDFVYDGAERLIEVNEVTGATTSRPLKVLTYGAANQGTNKRLGRLETATRYNYVDLATLIGQEDWHEYQV